MEHLNLEDWEKLAAIGGVLFGAVVTIVAGIYTFFHSRKSKEEKEKLNLEIQHLKINLSKISSDEDCTSLVRPDYYSFEYLKKKAQCDYGKGCGILTIQYGSTTSSHTEEANDVDYLVLIHGNYYTNESKAEIEGASHDFDHPNIPNVDLQKRLFDAFLFGVVVGKPYNVSVAIDGKVKNHHNLSPNYWYFIQLVVANIRFRKEKLLSEMDNEISEYSEDFYREVIDENPQEAVIAAYNYVCSRIQRHAISNLPETFGAKEIYPLAKPKYLASFIVEESKKNAFKNLVNLFKKKLEASSFDSLHETLMLLKNPI